MKLDSALPGRIHVLRCSNEWNIVVRLTTGVVLTNLVEQARLAS